MKVNLNFSIFIDVVEFEQISNKYFETLAQEFYDWYHEGKTLTHNSKTKFEINEDIYSWNGKTFVIWLNEVYPQANAKLIQTDIRIGNENKKYPYINLN